MAQCLAWDMLNEDGSTHGSLFETPENLKINEQRGLRSRECMLARYLTELQKTTNYQYISVTLEYIGKRDCFNDTTTMISEIIIPDCFICD